MAYHAASDLFGKLSARTTHGAYKSAIVSVLGPLRGKLLQFSALLLHRLVEEFRWGALLSAVRDDDGPIFMTDSPETADPDNPTDGHELRRWTRDSLGKLMRLIADREAMTKQLGRELDRIAADAKRVEGWLEGAMSIYAAHLEMLDKIAPENTQDRRESKERSQADRATPAHPFFAERPPRVGWAARELFEKGRKGAEETRLAQWLNIYKHGRSRGQLAPLALSPENYRKAKILDYRMHEMRSRSAEVWAASKRDDAGEDFNDAVIGLLTISKMALEADEAAIESEWEMSRELIDDALPSKKTAAKPKKKRDWSAFRKKTKPASFTQEVIKSSVRYKRDSLGRFSK